MNIKAKKTARQKAANKKANVPAFEPVDIEPMSGPADFTRRVAEVLTAEIERISVLMEFYGLEKGDWCQLAFALARDHVPGFRADVVPPKKGRRLKENLFDLVGDVEYLHFQNRLNISKACDKLAGQGRWQNADTRSLEKRYYADRKRIAGNKKMAIVYTMWTKMVETGAPLDPLLAAFKEQFSIIAKTANMQPTTKDKPLANQKKRRAPQK